MVKMNLFYLVINMKHKSMVSPCKRLKRGIWPNTWQDFYHSYNVKSCGNLGYTLALKLTESQCIHIKSQNIHCFHLQFILNPDYYLIVWVSPNDRINLA